MQVTPQHQHQSNPTSRKLIGVLVLVVLGLAALLPGCLSETMGATGITSQAVPLPAPIAATATVQAAQTGAGLVLAQSNLATQEAVAIATEQAAQLQSATVTSRQATLDALAVDEAKANRDRARAELDQQQAIAAAQWLTVTAQAAHIQATITAQPTITAQHQREIDQADRDANTNYLIGFFAKLALVGLGTITIAALIYRFLLRADAVQQPHPNGQAFLLTPGRWMVGAPNATVIWDPHALPSLASAAPPYQAVEPEIPKDQLHAMFSARWLIDVSINFGEHLSQLGDEHRTEHDHGLRGHQLLTARECLRLKSEFVSTRDWQAAVDYLTLTSRVAYRRNGGKVAGENGVFTNQQLYTVAMWLERELAPHSDPGSPPTEFSTVTTETGNS